MSDVQARPAASRGRGSGRGGRGGLSGRGGRSGGRPNGHAHAHDKAESKTETDNPSAFGDDEQGAIGELKKLYGSKTPLIKEMFPEWSEVDILFALQETDGDETEAATRIAEGTISQWGEVSKSKKAPRNKKDSTAAGSINDSSMSTSKPARGGRHVSESGRGRGRTSDRGGRGGRGRSSQAVTTNGARSNKEDQRLSVPTEESTVWDAKPQGADTVGETAPAAAAAATAADVTTNDAPASTPAPSSGPKTWASMLRQSTVPKPVAKPKEAPAPKPVETIEPLPPAAPSEPEPEANAEPEAEPQSQTEPHQEAAPRPQEEEATTAEVPTAVVEPEVALPPSQDQLTETNLEQVDDVSHPPATQTAASTAADSWDPRFNSASATATPLSASHHQHQTAARAAAAIPAAPASGYAASALKATTGGAPRTPSFQRRVLDQEEAVRMPGNREVDRAAVQFGAFSLGGDEDIDGDREEPETRAQPPADSPVALPRASLPPAPPQPAIPDAFGEQKAGPPAASAAVAGPVSTGAAAPAAAPATSTAAPQAAPASQAPANAPQGPAQYSRFGQPPSQDAASFGQKPLDPFAQQIPASSGQGQLDGFPSQPTQQQQQPNQPQQQPAQAQQQQPQQQGQQQTQQPGGAYSSAPGEYSSYYTSEQHGRGPYNYYGQPYGQQGGQGQQQQDAASGQQRAFGGYNANASQAENISQYPQSGGALHNQSRYGGAVASDAQNSGHTTPNPTTQSQQQQGGAAAAAGGTGQGSQPQTHGQQNYPYGSHPYYNNPYYSNYMGYGGHFGQQGGYGAPYGKGGMYAPYGMSPQGPYEHASSPASGFGGQSSLHRGADSALGSGLGGDYGRAGSAQATNPAGLGGSGFGGIQDSFARGGSSSFPTQSGAGQGYNASTQPTAGGSTNDDLKPFGEGKTGVSGPSPSLGGARPGSATQNNPAGQSGLPPPQSSSQMGGYGGYPSHLQGHGVHGGSGYGMGGASGQHGNAGFGSYGQGYGSGYYGGSGQQRGWGGNYH
ncbi:hypothetical protein ACRALDRAFT_2040972 [Sodiomyces alcalophilus JCM 7366]|uniref:uncharacterized protein n=1 Tax=Sodiomyces alcalophilus JCM 7366 TaxID=591952 RepID=UPI0039B69984